MLHINSILKQKMAEVATQMERLSVTESKKAGKPQAEKPKPGGLKGGGEGERFEGGAGGWFDRRFITRCEQMAPYFVPYLVQALGREPPSWGCRLKRTMILANGTPKSS